MCAWAPAPEDELTSGIVFRLPKVTEQFPRDSKKPFPTHFAFSSEERRVGEAEGKWLVSVWDRARTTPAQARAIMRTSAERIAFGMRIPDIRAIEVNGCGLTVVRDPLPPEYDGIGRNGHCGIAGLRCGNSADQKQLRFLLSEVATLRLD
jgi:hypothetical protein